MPATTTREPANVSSTLWLVHLHVIYTLHSNRVCNVRIAVVINAAVTPDSYVTSTRATTDMQRCNRRRQF